MVQETSMQYFIELPNDGSHDQGVTLQFINPDSFSHNIVVMPEDKRFFQRIKIYDEGLIVIEEVWQDKRILRFNKPFEREGDVLKFL